MFDKRQTNIAKGIAVLMLLWHHLFFETLEVMNSFTPVFKYHDVPAETVISVFFKICVAIFVFLSGFGLYKSYTSYLNKNSMGGGNTGIKEKVKYAVNHVLHLLSNFWFIYIIFVPLGFIFNYPPTTIYENNFWYFLRDFFGMSGWNGGGGIIQTMNSSWWFMTLIIFLNMFFPLIFKIFEKFPEISIVFTLFIIFVPLYILPDVACVKEYLFPFVIGMYFSKFDVFERIPKRIQLYRICIPVLLLLILITFYYKVTIFKVSVELDGMFILPVILLSFLVISNIPVLNNVLENLGKHSGNIYMFHVFIYDMYFKTFIYSFKYSIIIFVVLTVVCYGISVLLELIKKWTRYDKLFEIITNKIAQV